MHTKTCSRHFCKADMIGDLITILGYHYGSVKYFSDKQFQGFQSGKFKIYLKISALKGCSICQYISSEKYIFLNRDLCLISRDLCSFSSIIMVIVNQP